MKILIESSILESLDNKIDLNKIKCINDAVKKELKNNSYDERWGELRSINRKLDFYIEHGTFMSDIEENDEILNSFLNDLNYKIGNYKRGENVTNNFPELKKEKINVFKAIGDGILFRGVSYEDYLRIKKQNHIDSDMRGAITPNEGINLAQNPATSQYYLPHGKEGVILAIKPTNLDLYMLSDDYIRVFHPIPYQNIIKASKVFKKENKFGSILSDNPKRYLDKIYTQLKEYGINFNNC